MYGQHAPTLPQLSFVAISSLNLISKPKKLIVPKLKLASNIIQFSKGGIMIYSKYREANVRIELIQLEKRFVLSQSTAPIWDIGGFLVSC
jgi:hypothetical protein